MKVNHTIPTFDGKLFRKAACLTDTHFGRNGNSNVALNDSLEFIEWFIEESKIWGAETCIFLGDWFDNRAAVGLQTLDAGLRGMELLSNAFEKVIWFPGNHDLMFRDKRDISSVAFTRLIPNIHYVVEPTTVGNCTILPWLVGDERKLINKIRDRYVFAHLECAGFLSNGGIAVPAHPHMPSPDDFIHPEIVFTGHFHARARIKNVQYMGSALCHNFSDDWDSDRGLMFLEWGKDPIFRAWPDQPLFRTMNLSDLVSNPNKFLRPKLTARVAMDVDITFEEASFLKDELTKVHQLRRFELIPAKKTGVDNEEATLALGTVQFQTVDQIVFDGLSKLDLEGYKSETLREIYISCAEGTLK